MPRDSIDARLHDPRVIAAMRETFNADGAIAIASALSPAGLSWLQNVTVNGWTAWSVPDRHSYSVLAQQPHLSDVAAVVRRITGSSLSKLRCLRFSCGDYTLLHDRNVMVRKNRTVAFLIIDTWSHDWGGDLVWVSGEETRLRLLPAVNMLYIIREQKGMHRFIKYVNHRAKNRSFRIMMLC